MKSLLVLQLFSAAVYVSCITVDDGLAIDAGACSLPLSREASAIIAAHWDASLLAIQQPFTMPPNCPLLPSPSRFSLLASRGDVTNRDGSVTCQECGAQFATHADTDVHLIAKHPHLIHPDAHCLSHSCDVLGCPSLPGVLSCTDHSIAVTHRRCLHIMHQCFDGDSPAARAVFTEMARRVCTPLRCVDNRRTLTPLDAPPSPGWAALAYWLKFTLVGGFVAAFYGFFWVYRREATIQDDLTRLAVKRRHLQTKLFEKEKLKGY